MNIELFGTQIQKIEGKIIIVEGATPVNWVEWSRLQDQLISLKQKRDESAILDDAQTRWDTMSPKERDVYQIRPESLDDFRGSAGPVLGGHESDNPDNKPNWD